MSLFSRGKKDNLKKDFNDKDDTQLKLSLLDKKLKENFKKSEYELEKEVASILLKNKNDKDKILWNLYIPYVLNGEEIYRKIDCLLIKENRIFIIQCEDFKECFRFKEINNEVWEYEYFSEKKLGESPIHKVKKSLEILSQHINLDNRLDLFYPIIVLVGADSSKNIFKEKNEIYIRNSHRNKLEKFLIDIIENEQGKKILSDKWILKITEKLIKHMNPTKKILKLYKNQNRDGY